MPTVSRNQKLLSLIALWLLITYWSWRLIYPAVPPPWIFLDNLNLLIHEAGHWIFMPFGLFMHILGGSLNQCLFPAIFMTYFIWKKDWAGAAFGLFWLGNNFINVSYYIGDAQAMALPLLGGDTSGHDWHNLLTMTNALDWTDTLANLVRGIGTVCLFAAVIGLAIYILLLYLSPPAPSVKNKA